MPAFIFLLVLFLPCALYGADRDAAVAFVQTHCIDCHTRDDPEGGLELESFAAGDLIVGADASIDIWNRVGSRVHLGEMPPPESDAPPLPEREAFVAWVQNTIRQSICDQGPAAGPPILRRLNRGEYGNTIRDLLGIHVNAAHALPGDGAGGEGFDNASETLFISPIHAEKYLDAARLSLSHALKDPGGLKRLIVARPGPDLSPNAAARKVLKRFLDRAFRRPATRAELDAYADLFDAAYAQDQLYMSALQFSMEAVLVSPKFLFLWEEPVGAEPERVSQYELASRLSYFLWASMPDEQLMQLADENKLDDDQVLAEQVARMLHSRIDERGHRSGAKVNDFATSFMEQWLGTRALGREFSPDESVAQGYDSELEGGMKYEPIFFFEDLLSENRSLLNFIDSDFTYANSRLAKHYQLKGTFRQQPKRVSLPEDSRRGGLLGMSSVLAVSSLPHRTSPVLRGKWILDTLLGTPPSPPPPGVEELAESDGHEAGMSLRERLELHRAKPICASCHASIDPLGFGLENFDVLGRWRTEAEGEPIDASGELPDGTQFEGPQELRRLLLERKNQFARNLTSRMLGYALARGLTHRDQCVVEEIAQALAEDDYKAQTLIVEIVNSVPFRTKQQLSPSGRVNESPKSQ